MVTGLSVSHYQKLKDTQSVFASIIVAYVLSLRRAVEFRFEKALGTW